MIGLREPGRQIMKFSLQTCLVFYWPTLLSCPSSPQTRWRRRNCESWRREKSPGCCWPWSWCRRECHCGWSPGSTSTGRSGWGPPLSDCRTPPLSSPTVGQRAQSGAESWQFINGCYQWHQCGVEWSVSRHPGQPGAVKNPKSKHNSISAQEKLCEGHKLVKTKSVWAKIVPDDVSFWKKGFFSLIKILLFSNKSIENFSIQAATIYLYFHSS